MAPRKPAAAAPASNPTRRSARLQEAAIPKPRITKPKPAPTPEPQKYDCTTCGRTLTASAFPDHLPTDNCKHLINTCKACTKMHISVQLESTTYDRMACPECVEVLANADVKRLAAKEVYARFDEIERRGISEKVPGWRWCLSPRCRGGQVHEPLLKKADGTEEADIPDKTKKRGTQEAHATEEKGEALSGKSKQAGIKKKLIVTTAAIDQQNEDNIFTCETCNAKACATCDRPYHDGETCAQYQARQNREEEAATLKTIAQKCKQCPQCARNIEKNGGCDAVVSVYGY
ncbi:hypothetical protein LTR08_002367 [Meristemomyces frigidus]|nr:hypothetical protein LTR08_002367 [Meristemomyces frigidus]